MESEIQLFMLKTQEIREKAAEQLQNWISNAERAAEKTQNESTRREWLKLAGFLHQILNGLLKAYDDVHFNEGMQKLRDLIKRAQEKQAWLEAWEQNLKLKEEELNRKLAALAKAQQASQT